MTEDEYLHQGVSSTQIELDNLRRAMAESPHVWKTLERLDNPKRFTSFVNGSPHMPCICESVNQSRSL